MSVPPSISNAVKGVVPALILAPERTGVCENVTTPFDAIAIASLSDAEPILPASAGQGVFMNTTSGALTLTLPASPSIGDEVTFIDYAGTFDSNNLTIARNSSKILGAEADLTVGVERAANTLVFTDSTQGWLFKTK